MIVLHDGTLDDILLNFRRLLSAFEDQEDERHQEVLLLTEVLLVLHLCHLEGIHGDGMFLGITDIDTTEITADALIRVARVDNHHIGVLLEILAHHRIHEKALTTT